MLKSQPASATVARVLDTCPRCHSRTHASPDREAAALCLNCGPIFLPTISLAEARAEVAGQPSTRIRKRRRSPFAGISSSIGRITDGCYVSPSCLECPLKECKDIAPSTPWLIG